MTAHDREDALQRWLTDGGPIPPGLEDEAHELGRLTEELAGAGAADRERIVREAEAARTELDEQQAVKRVLALAHSEARAARSKPTWPLAAAALLTVGFGLWWLGPEPLEPAPSDLHLDSQVFDRIELVLDETGLQVEWSMISTPAGARFHVEVNSEDGSQTYARTGRPLREARFELGGAELPDRVRVRVWVSGQEDLEAARLIEVPR